MTHRVALAVMPSSPERDRLMQYFRDCNYSPITALVSVPEDFKTITAPAVAVVDLNLPRSRTLVDFIRESYPDTCILGIPTKDEDPKTQPKIHLYGGNLSLEYELRLLLAHQALLDSGWL